MSLPRLSSLSSLFPLCPLFVVVLCAACSRAGFEAEREVPPPPDDLGAADTVTGRDATLDDAVPAPDLGATTDAVTSEPPKIQSVTIKNGCIPEHRSTNIAVVAIDPAGGKLGVAWSSSAGGTFKGTGIAVNYTPPATPYACTHTITAKVTSSVSGLSAQESAALKVTLFGDLNQDGTVNMVDYGIHANNNGKTGCCVSTAPCYVADLNQDCMIDAADFALLNANWLRTGCACPP